MVLIATGEAGNRNDAAAAHLQLDADRRAARDDARAAGLRASKARHVLGARLAPQAAHDASGHALRAPRPLLGRRAALDLGRRHGGPRRRGARTWAVLAERRRAPLRHPQRIGRHVAARCEAASGLQISRAADRSLADASVGTVLDALHRADRERDTLVVATADHGASFLGKGHACAWSRLDAGTSGL